MGLDCLLPGCLAHIPGNLVLVGRKPPFLVTWTSPRDCLDDFTGRAAIALLMGDSREPGESWKDFYDFV